MTGRKKPCDYRTFWPNTKPNTETWYLYYNHAVNCYINSAPDERQRFGRRQVIQNTLFLDMKENKTF